MRAKDLKYEVLQTNLSQENEQKLRDAISQSGAAEASAES